jgi:hypothetical protein
MEDKINKLIDRVHTLETYHVGFQKKLESIHLDIEQKHLQTTQKLDAIIEFLSMRFSDPQDEVQSSHGDDMCEAISVKLNPINDNDLPNKVTMDLNDDISLPEFHNENNEGNNNTYNYNNNIASTDINNGSNNNTTYTNNSKFISNNINNNKYDDNNDYNKNNNYIDKYHIAYTKCADNCFQYYYNEFDYHNNYQSIYQYYHRSRIKC